MKGFSSLDFEIPLFIMLSGYLDSKQAPKSKWSENLAAFSLNVLIAIWGKWNASAMQTSFKFDGGHRWYLQYYILCNLLHSCFFLPLSERVPKHYLAVVKVAIVLLVCRVSTLLQYVNVCDLGAAVDHLAFYLSKDGCKLVVHTSETSALFGLVPMGGNETWLFPLYTVTWWYGPDIIAQSRKHVFVATSIAQYSATPLLVAAQLCLVYWLGLSGRTLLDVYFFPNKHDSVPTRIIGSQFAFASSWPFGYFSWSSTDQRSYFSCHLLGLLFALLTIQIFALGYRSAWFPKSVLEYLGTCSLGTYVIHVFVWPPTFAWLQTILPAFGGWPGAFGPVGGLLQFVLCFLYAALYAGTVGRICQMCLVNLSSQLQNTVSFALASSRRTDAALQKQQEQAHQGWNQLRTRCFDHGGVLCIDGGTGSEVQREAEKLGHDEAVNSAGWSCVQWKTHPDVLKGVHASYFRSGANLVIANSYATNRHIMKAAGYEDLTCEGTTCCVCLASEARDAFAEGSCWESSTCASSIPNLVAGSMSCHPPGMAHGANMDMGKWPEPKVENEGYLEQARLLRDAGADVIFVEMVWEWKEHGRRAVRAAVASGMPVVVCLAIFNEKSCEEEMPQLHDGTLVEEVARELASGDVWTNVVGICVHHTNLPLILPCLMAMRRGGWEGVIGAYPDHGTFKMPHWCFEQLEADKIVTYISEWVAKARCQIVGGCCGIGPETISVLSAWCEKFNASKGI
jgi:5-methyltetrahydrofolate--homocysteine methyltransferase